MIEAGKGGRKERRAGTKWEKLVAGEMISLVLSQYQMKLQTKLAVSHQDFDLFLNGESIMDLERFIEEEAEEEESKDESGQASDLNKIKADEIIVNSRTIMESSDMKTLRGWQSTLDRQLKEAKALLEEQSIEIKDLALSQSNFVGVIESLI